VKRSHAFSGRDLLPDRHDNLLERELTVSEHRSGRYRELGAAFRLRASETTSADAVRLQATTARAIRLAAVVSPAEVNEQAIGVVLGERPDLLGVKIANIRAQERMLSEAFLRIRPGATVVSRTSGLLRRRGRRSSASGWEFASGACSGFRSIRRT
jgi:hypothetical protein